LGCTVSIDFIYKTSSGQEASSLMKKSSTLVSTDLYEHLQRNKSKNEFVDISEYHGTQGFMQDYNTYNGVGCHVSYWFPEKIRFYLSIEERERNEGLLITLSCGKR